MMSKRHEKICHILRQCGLDAVLLVHPPNIRYLCGFSGTEGVLVIGAEKDVWLLVDSRYTLQAQEETQSVVVEECRGAEESAVRLLKREGMRRVGFEAEYMVVSRLAKLETGDIEWVGLKNELRALRGIKSPAEIEYIRKAARINAGAFAEIESLIHAGLSERRLALELEFAIKRLGGEEKAFDFIVASGSRGAMPHGVASDKFISSGEFVTIDFGGRLHGYHCDETLTLGLGEPSEELLKVYDIVQEAHDRARKSVCPGRSLKEVDAVARDFIREKGYGEFFGHGLGHGVGLEIHEYPLVSSRSEDVAEEGMVFTVEPGIYLPDVGGVRIEDTVVVTADGCEALTVIPKWLHIIKG